MAVSAAAPGADYSGAPLAGKPGVVAGSRVDVVDAPFACRAVVAPCRAGAVDIKVCAVDTVGSGLKLVVRRELRA